MVEVGGISFPGVPATVRGHREPARARRGTNVIFYRPRPDRAIRRILYTLLKTGLSEAPERNLSREERILLTCRQESRHRSPRANSRCNAGECIEFFTPRACRDRVAARIIRDYDEISII